MLSSYRDRAREMNDSGAIVGTATDGEVDEWPGTLRTLVNGVLFDQIEYRAYKYASGLKTYISSKAATGNVYVVAHSLGAVISSEALKRGAPMAKLE